MRRYRLSALGTLLAVPPREKESKKVLDIQPYAKKLGGDFFAYIDFPWDEQRFGLVKLSGSPCISLVADSEGSLPFNHVILKSWASEAIARRELADHRSILGLIGNRDE